MNADVTANEKPQTELERLREEVAFLKTCGMIELAVRNPNVMSYMEHWENRAETAEALVEALRELQFDPA